MREEQNPLVRANNAPSRKTTHTQSDGARTPRVLFHSKYSLSVSGERWRAIIPQALAQQPSLFSPSARFHIINVPRSMRMKDRPKKGAVLDRVAFIVMTSGTRLSVVPAKILLSGKSPSCPVGGARRIRTFISPHTAFALGFLMTVSEREISYECPRTDHLLKLITCFLPRFHFLGEQRWWEQKTRMDTCCYLSGCIVFTEIGLFSYPLFPQSSGSGNASLRCSMSSSADFSDEDDCSVRSGCVSPAPGDTLPWNLPRHERSKRKIHGGSVLDPAERAVLRIAG